MGMGRGRNNLVMGHRDCKTKVSRLSFSFKRTTRLRYFLVEETWTPEGEIAVRSLGIAWALVQFYFRIIPARWYIKAPFLPLPPPTYLKWRLRTAYGRHRPPLAKIVHDVWQFGDWLRTYKEG